MRPDLWGRLEEVIVDPGHKSWKDVLRCLVYHANGDGEAWPSIDTIRAECSYKSRRAVISALQGLRALGIIRSVGVALPGRGQSVVYDVNEVINHVDRLGELSTKMEATSHLSEAGGEATSVKGEATSVKGEATSAKGEATAPKDSKNTSSNSSSNSSESFRGILPVEHIQGSQIGAIKAKIEEPVDYLKCCGTLGWKPNGKGVRDKARARKAVLACAMLEGLCRREAEEWVRRNAITKWNCIDDGNCVRDMAVARAAQWRSEDFEGWKAERRRRDEAKRLRANNC